MTGHPPRPASTELLALAAATRPDWDPHALREALAQARNCGMTWPLVLVAAAQLLADPDSQPHDLIPAAPEPWRHRRPGPGPETYARGSAAARAAMHRDDTTTHHD